MEYPVIAYRPISAGRVEQQFAAAEGFASESAGAVGHHTAALIGADACAQINVLHRQVLHCRHSGVYNGVT